MGSGGSYWDSILYSGMAPVLNGPTAWSTTIASVDAQTGTYTRKRLEDNRLDVWKVNSPAIGLRHRAATSNASEMISLIPGNTGLTLGIAVNGSFYDISVGRP